MGLRCFNCGKGIMVGRQHKHHPGVAGQRWKKRAPKTIKVFKPNLHVARIEIGGLKKRVRLCTKCLRLLKGRSKKMQKETLSPSTQPQTIPAAL